MRRLPGETGAGGIGERGTGVMKKICLLAVRAYQACLGPFFGGNCRFYPSCSNYACEAIEGHGAGRGTWLALRRVLRCHPFSPGGIDLVPDGAADPAATVRRAAGRQAGGEFAR
jgi:uncharacterized protein